MIKTVGICSIALGSADLNIKVVEETKIKITLINKIIENDKNSR